MPTRSLIRGSRLDKKLKLLWTQKDHGDGDLSLEDVEFQWISMKFSEIQWFFPSYLA